MEEKKGQGDEGEDEPGVEVEEEVLEVEGPRLGAIEVGAARGGEDVVLDDVPRDDLDLFVKEGVDGCVSGLGVVLVNKPDMGSGIGKRTTRTRVATTPRISRMNDSKKRSLSLSMAKKTSSNTKGAQSAMAKGQPRTPPRANQNMPCDVFRPPRQFMKAAAPTMAMYMAKLEGR